MKSVASKSVDAYITDSATEARGMLKQIRAAIKTVAPKAEEKISYQMPAYMYHGALVYFGAFKDHVSLFAVGRARKIYETQLKKYKTSKGTIQFPFGKPLPIPLIKKIVKSRVKENEERMKAKKKAYGK